jgi:hypothetical protein
MASLAVFHESAKVIERLFMNVESACAFVDIAVRMILKTAIFLFISLGLQASVVSTMRRTSAYQKNQKSGPVASLSWRPEFGSGVDAP